MKKKKRLLAIILMICMIANIMTSFGSSTINSGVGVATQRSYDQMINLNNINSNQVIVISKNVNSVYISGNSQWKDNIRIELEEGRRENLEVTIENVNITKSTWDNSLPIIDVTQDGIQTILRIKGNNNITNNSKGPAIGVKHGATLIVEAEMQSAKLDAQGGQQGSGIGGYEVASLGDWKLKINSGQITAKGGQDAAGIGAGKGVIGGEVTVAGGSISAQGGLNGAGIGGGLQSSISKITISGGQIRNVQGGGEGAGIGGGNGDRVGEINITNKELESVKGGSNSAAIGGGEGSYISKINISDTKIENIQGSDQGAAIGGGNKGSVGEINIADSEIGTIKGGNNASAIGGGNKAETSKITITNTKVNNIQGGAQGAGIGGGNTGNVGKIIIEDTIIDTIKTEQNGAAIGGGAQSTVNKVTITNTQVNDIQGGDFAAGIGGGNGGTTKEINITNSLLRRIKGGQQGPGIGDNKTTNQGGKIILKNSTLFAIGGQWTNDIGGKSDNAFDVTIQGGYVFVGNDRTGKITTETSNKHAVLTMYDQVVSEATLVRGKEMTFKHGEAESIIDVPSNSSGKVYAWLPVESSNNGYWFEAEFNTVHKNTRKNGMLEVQNETIANLIFNPAPAPFKLELTSVPEGVKLDWNKLSCGKGSPEVCTHKEITHYNIYRKKIDETQWEKIGKVGKNDNPTYTDKINNATNIEPTFQNKMVQVTYENNELIIKFDKAMLEEEYQYEVRAVHSQNDKDESVAHTTNIVTGGLKTPVEQYRIQIDNSEGTVPDSSITPVKLINSTGAELVYTSPLKNDIDVNKTIWVHIVGVNGSKVSAPIHGNTKIDMQNTNAEIEISVFNQNGNLEDQHKLLNSTPDEYNKIFDNPHYLSIGAQVGFKIKDEDLELKQYQFIKSEGVPNFPENGANTWIDLEGETIKKVEPNTPEAYPDLINIAGQISTRHYEYAFVDKNYPVGESPNRADTFKEPIGENPMVIQKSTIAQGNNYSDEDGASAFYGDSNISQTGGANKAVKFWGYLKPDLSGKVQLAAFSDDGAYGYIVIGEEKVEFVEDWRIQAATDRYHEGVTVELKAGNVYPIYMEWYEGKATNKAFIPRYKTAGDASFQNIPSSWFYASSNTTPGESSEGIFEVTTVDTYVDFPQEEGTYYIALEVKGKDKEPQQILYGPFVIVKPIAPTLVEGNVNYIMPQNKASISYSMTVNNNIIDVVHRIDLSEVVGNTLLQYNLDVLNNIKVSIKKKNNEQWQNTNIGYTKKLEESNTQVELILSFEKNSKAELFEQGIYRIDIEVPNQFNSQTTYDEYKRYIGTKVPVGVKVIYRNVWQLEAQDTSGNIIPVQKGPEEEESIQGEDGIQLMYRPLPTIS